MFKSYLKVAVRNLQRQRTYSAVNTLGLATGMSCSVLILLYIHDEISFDRYHVNADRIYRVVRQYSANGDQGSAHTSAHDGPALQKDYPYAIESNVRLRRLSVTISYGSKRYIEERLFFADPTVFGIFSFSILQGDEKTPLVEPNTIFLTESAAERYFGSSNPVGKVLKIDKEEYVIEGIVKDVPYNSHFHFDFLASFSSLDKNTLGDWGFANYYTYILVRERRFAKELVTNLPGVIERYMGKQEASRVRLDLQPLTRIHLHSHLGGEIEPNGDITQTYLYSAIALFVLLIACINYVNLATARSSRRSREIAVRKLVGATRSELFRQLVSESIILSSLSVIIACAIVELSLPWFNGLINRNLELGYASGWNSLVLVGLALVVGMLSGSYPAVFLASFQVNDTMRGLFKTGKGQLFLRKGLVVFQFSLSVVMITGTLVVYMQAEHMKTKKLGINEKNVVVIPMSPHISDRFDAIRNEFLRNDDVRIVTASIGIPGEVISREGVRVEGSMERKRIVYTLMSDRQFPRTLEMKVLKGKDFSTTPESGNKTYFIVNETAAQEFGWEDPIGKEIDWFSRARKGVVVGLVKDFHFASLHHSVEPILIASYPLYTHILVRLRHQQAAETLEYLEEVLNKIAPDYPFSYRFLSDSFIKLYEAETKLLRIITCFSALTILVACLGLFGLAAFSAEQRTKEIAIRKTVGASHYDIARFLSKEFLSNVALSIIIGWVVSHIVLNRWLEDFAYRIDLSVTIFLNAAIIVVITAILAVGRQAAKAALANPVNALKV